MADDDMPPIPKTATVKAPRPPAVDKAVELAVGEMAQLRYDAEQAREDKQRAIELCDKAKDHILKLQDDIADLKSRCTMYQLERDESVARHAKLQGLFIALQAQLRAFEIPMTPIIHERVAQDAEAPKDDLPPSDDPRWSHGEMASAMLKQ